MTVHTTRIPDPHCVTPQAWRAMMRPQEHIVPFTPGKLAPFMALPKEIRDMVYRELLVADIPLQLIHDRPLWPDLYTPGKQLHINILRLSKQVHSEASCVLYGNNTFYVSIDGGAAGPLEAVYGEDGIRIPLAPSIPRYIPLLRRVAMYSGVPGQCMTKLRCHWLLNSINLDLNQLTFFAMLFPDRQTFRMNEQICEYWLTPMSGREIYYKHVWFPVKELGKMACAWWLVMKQDGQRRISFMSEGNEVV